MIVSGAARAAGRGLRKAGTDTAPSLLRAGCSSWNGASDQVTTVPVAASSPAPAPAETSVNGSSTGCSDNPRRMVADSIRARRDTHQQRLRRPLRSRPRVTPNTLSMIQLTELQQQQRLQRGLSQREEQPKRVRSAVRGLMERRKARDQGVDSVTEASAERKRAATKHIRALIDSKTWAGIFSLFAAARTEGIRFGPEQYDLAIQGIAGIHQWLPTLQLLTEMHVYGLRPEAKTVRQTLYLVSLALRVEEAAGLLEDMTRIWDIQSDCRDCSRVMGACSKVRNYELMIEVFVEHLCRFHQYEERQKQLRKDELDEQQEQQQEQRAGPPLVGDRVDSDANEALDPFVYGKVLTACAKTGNFEMAVSLLDGMQANGVSPTNYHFGPAIDACARAGQYGHAMRLLRSMPSLGLKPSEVTFGAAINACSQEGEYEAAVQLMEDMKTMDVRPTVVHYTTAMLVCGNAGQAELAIGLLEKMQAEGIQPNNFTWSTVLSACSKLNLHDRAMDVWNDYKKKRAEQRARWAARESTAAAAAAAADDDDEATAAHGEGAVEKAAAQTGSEVEPLEQEMVPNEVLYCAAMNACAHVGDPDEALALLAEMKDNKVTPNVLNYNAVMNSLAKAGRAKEAVALLRKIQAEADAMDAAREEEHRRQRWDREQQQHQQQQQENGGAQEHKERRNNDRRQGRVTHRGHEWHSIRPTSVSYNTCVDGVLKEGDFATACLLMAEMKVNGLGPTQVTYGSFMTAADHGAADDRMVDTLYEQAVLDGVCSHWKYWGEAIDLHECGLSRAKAILRYVLVKEGVRTKELVVITGRGINSEGQEPILKPAVMEYVRQELRLPVQESLINPGRIIIDCEGFVGIPDGVGR